jgi:hypothetical protein
VWQHPAGSEPGRLTCIVCGVTAGSRSKLLSHLRIHVKTSLHKCAACYKLFDSAVQVPIGVARFFLVQYSKTWKYIPYSHKMAMK